MTPKSRTMKIDTWSTFRARSTKTLSFHLMVCWCQTIIWWQASAQQLFPNTNAFRLQRVWRPEEMFPPNYNNQQAPIANLTSALDVEVSLHVHDIRLSDRQNSLLIDVLFTQLWVDDRLVSPPALPPTPDAKLTLDYRWKQAFWTPQLQFTNGQTVQLNQLIEPLVFLTVSGRNRVQMTARLTVEIGCDSHSSASDTDSTPTSASSTFTSRRDSSGSYPFDRRECVLQLISLSSPVETVALRWKQFQVAATRVSGFVVSPGRTEHCISRLQDASFACLRARFRLRRSLGAVWSSVFVPGLCAVLLGYLSLWIPLHSLYVQPRASVLLIAIAIVCVQFLTLSFAQLPLAQPNHNGALRTWLIVCLSFCLAAFGEFVLAIYHQRLRGALVRQWVDQQNRKNQNTLVRGATIALRNRSQPLPMDSMAGNHRSNSINSSHPPVQPMHHDPASRVPLPMTTSSNSVHYASADVPIDDHQSANHSTIDPSISSRLLSKLLMLNQTPADEKEQFENVWLDQLFKILYPISFVVIAIVYVLVNI